MPETAALAELYRNDFAMFAYRFLQARMKGRKLHWGFLHDLICHRCMQLERGDFLRLIVNAQPRSLKSEICSVAFPAWLLLRDPNRQVAGISYEE